MHWDEGGLTLRRVGGTEQRGVRRVVATHLLEDHDEEAHLKLGAALEERVERGGALSFREDAEPLLDRRELGFEVDVEGGGGHLFKSRFIVLKIFEPAINGCDSEQRGSQYTGSTWRSCGDGCGCNVPSAASRKQMLENSQHMFLPTSTGSLAAAVATVPPSCAWAPSRNAQTLFHLSSRGLVWAVCVRCRDRERDEENETT